MRYVAEQGEHSTHAYVYDTLMRQVVAQRTPFHVAMEMADDLNAIDAKYPAPVTAPVVVPKDTLARLRVLAKDNEYTAKVAERDAVDLIAMGRERDALPKSRKAQAARYLAADIRVTLKLLGVEF